MSLQTEETNINCAVRKLEELSLRMKSTDFGFKDKDVRNIDVVISAIRELDKERLRMHDKLETETIKASVLRHKLQFLPSQIKNEIMKAVNSARQSNTKSLEDLQNQLDTINHNIITMGKEQQELERENSQLHPEREMIRQQHEEIISLLNQRLAEKASMQITLNETRDKVRSANQNIVDLEDGILQLKEDLIQERTEARHEKKRLKRAVADTSDQTKEQTEINFEKKKEFDQLQDQLQESIGKLDIVKKKVRRYEATIKKLEKEEKQLNSQLKKQLDMNQNLVDKGAAISVATSLAHEEFAIIKEELAAKIKRYEADVETELVKNDGFTDKSISLEREIETRLQEKLANGDKVKSLDQALQAAKTTLSRKAEEVGKLQTENSEIEEQTVNILESHKAVVAQLNNQLDDLREQVEKERKDRMEMQTKKDSVHKVLEEIKSDTQKILITVNTKIQEGKSKHVELTNEGAHLQRELREDESVLTTLKTELEEVQQQYQELYDTLDYKVNTVETEIDSMTNEMDEKTQILEEHSPVFEEFEKSYQSRTEDFEKMKKDIVVMKTQKNNLEDNIRKSKMTKEKLIKPVEKLRVNLKEKKEEYMKMLTEHGEKTQSIEQEIYLEGCKLKTVLEENSKFKEECNKLEKDIKDIHRQMIDNDNVTVTVTSNLLDTRDELVKHWAEDKDMQEFFATRDQDTVDAFGKLLLQTEKREVKIGEVSVKLEDELTVLTKFLDNVARRRPKESRERKSPSRGGSRMSQKSSVIVQPSQSNKTPRSQSRSPRSTSKSRSPRSTSKSPRPISSILRLQSEDNSGLTRSSTTLSSHSRKSAKFTDLPLPPIPKKELNQVIDRNC